MPSFEIRFSPRTTTILLLAAALPILQAQSSNPDAEAPHITALKGRVTLRTSAGVDAPGVVGQTLLAGDRLIVAGRSRAEVQFDNRVFELTANTEVRLHSLDQDTYQLQLDKGSFTCQVVEVPAAVAEVRTPSVGARLAQVGIYRMAITLDGESEITAYEGNIEVFAPGGSEWVVAGHKMIAHGPADNPEFKIVNAISRWKRILTLALASVQIAGNISSSMDSGSRSEHKAASTASKTAVARPPADKPPSAPHAPAPSRPSSPPPAKAR